MKEKKKKDGIPLGRKWERKIISLMSLPVRLARLISPESQNLSIGVSLNCQVGERGTRETPVSSTPLESCCSNRSLCGLPVSWWSGAVCFPDLWASGSWDLTVPCQHRQEGDPVWSGAERGPGWTQAGRAQAQVPRNWLFPKVRWQTMLSWEVRADSTPTRSLICCGTQESHCRSSSLRLPFCSRSRAYRSPRGCGLPQLLPN